MSETKQPKKYPKKKKYARVGQILTHTVYAYVEKENQAFAKEQGARPKYGTVSAYINALIAKDRGVAPAIGTKNQDKAIAERYV